MWTKIIVGYPSARDSNLVLADDAIILDESLWVINCVNSLGAARGGKGLGTKLSLFILVSRTYEFRRISYTSVAQFKMVEGLAMKPLAKPVIRAYAELPVAAEVRHGCKHGSMKSYLNQNYVHYLLSCLMYDDQNFLFISIICG